MGHENLRIRNKFTVMYCVDSRLTPRFIARPTATTNHGTPHRLQRDTEQIKGSSEANTSERITGIRHWELGEEQIQVQVQGRRIFGTDRRAHRLAGTYKSNISSI